MLFGKRLEKELKDLRNELEKKNEQIERLNSKFESLVKQSDDQLDMILSQSRIMNNHAEGLITYYNVESSLWYTEYVYIYKDRQEYKFDGVNLNNPVITRLSENLLKVYDKDKDVAYIFDLSNEKIIKY